MNKTRLNLLKLILIIVLIITLFTIRLSNKILISIVLLFCAIVTKRNVNSPKKIDLHEREVTFYLAGYALAYIALYYLIGVYAGFYKAVYQINFWTITRYIIPLIIIIISTEIIRKEFLFDKSRISILLTYIFSMLVDATIFASIVDALSLQGILDNLGLVVFSSIASSILYNYICVNFGIKPNIIYRLITILYLYIIPITPDVHIYFRILARIVYPILVFIVMSNTFKTKEKIYVEQNKLISALSTGLVMLLMLAFTMLISCQFTYGIIVVGSNSMANTISKGDAVIFETKVNPDEIKVGEVVIYNTTSQKIIHRVIDIKNINGEIRYYTKGDNNEQMDDGYRTIEDLDGRVNLKIGGIGWPTILINELFK